MGEGHVCAVLVGGCPSVPEELCSGAHLNLRAEGPVSHSTAVCFAWAVRRLWCLEHLLGPQGSALPKTQTLPFPPFRASCTLPHPSPPLVGPRAAVDVTRPT